MFLISARRSILQCIFRTILVQFSRKLRIICSTGLANTGFKQIKLRDTTMIGIWISGVIWGRAIGAFTPV